MRAAFLLLVCLLGAAAADAPPAELWAGVDEAVVKRIATDFGRPPHTPLINTDQGDLLLFLFLSAGAIGGFVAGWSARGLFGKRTVGKPCSPS